MKLLNQVAQNFAQYCVYIVCITINIFSDVDECLQENICQEKQTCENSEGSYKCSCPTGYLLNTDTKMCEGNVMLLVLVIILSLVVILMVAIFILYCILHAKK